MLTKSVGQCLQRRVVLGGIWGLALFVAMCACSSSDPAGSGWVVEEAQGSSASLYSIPRGTSIWLEADALVLSRGTVERRIPASVSRSGDVTTIELASNGGSTRLSLVKTSDGRMELVREGAYRLTLREVER